MLPLFDPWIKNINKEGRIKMVDITASKTPLAITRPISRPNVSCITTKAIKPAMVVIEELVIETQVAWMALAIASSLVFDFDFLPDIDAAGRWSSPLKQPAAKSLITHWSDRRFLQR